MAGTNRMAKLAERPFGMVKRENFSIEEGPLPEPGDGEFRVKVEYVSIDPAMRPWMNDGPSYVPPVAIGEVMRALASGTVDASNHPDYTEGDAVSGLFGVQQYAISNGQGVAKLDTSLASLERWIGGLGMPGTTAYFGLLEIGQPKEGETVVVSAASGAVGGIVGQIAKIKGCRAVGIAGGPQKCAYLTDELGFDAAIDHRAAGDEKAMAAALKEACPKGIDVYFDNVGGYTLDAVLTRINLHARIAICGMISEYNETEPALAPRPTRALLVNRARMQGLIVFDWIARYQEGRTQMAAWIKDGRIKYREDVMEGIENMPAAMLRLFSGKNFGKQLVKVGDDPA